MNNQDYIEDTGNIYDDDSVDYISTEEDANDVDDTIQSTGNIYDDDQGEIEPVDGDSYIEATGNAIEEKQRDEEWLITKAAKTPYRMVHDFLVAGEGDGEPILKKDYKPPGPSETKAPSQLLKVIPKEKHKEALMEIMALKKEGKLLSEEGVKRMTPFAGEEEAKNILIEGDQGQPYTRDISIMQAIKEGGQESVSGIIAGQGIDYDEMQKRAMTEIPMIKKVFKGLTKIGGDVPAIGAGMGIGAATSIPFGGPETPWGAIMTTAGAFAVPGMVHDAYEEAQRLVSEHPELKGKTLEQLSALANDREALKKIGLGAIKSSALGALVALNPIMAGLKSTPLAPMFEKPIIGGATALGAEAATLTVAPAIMEGKTPTWSDFIENAALMGTLHLATSGAKNLAGWAAKKKKTTQDVMDMNLNLKPEEAKKLDEARSIEDVETVLKDIESRKEGEAKPAEKAKPVVEDKEAREEAPHEKVVKEKDSKLPKTAIFRKPEDIRIGSEGGKGQASISYEKEGAYFPFSLDITKEEKHLIDASNQWSKAGDNKEAGKYAQQARETIFNRLKEVKKEKPSEVLAAKEPKPKPKPKKEPIKKMGDLTAKERGEYAELDRDLKSVKKEIDALIKDKHAAKSQAETQAKKDAIERYYQNLITDSVQEETSIARRMNDIARPEPRVLGPKEITKEKQRLESNMKDLLEQDDLLWGKKKDLHERRRALEKDNKDKQAQRQIKKRIDDIDRDRSEISKNIKNMRNELRNVGLKPERGVRYGVEQPEQVRLAPIRGKGEKVTPRHEIISMFRDAFKDTPIRIGKLPKKKDMKISGVFKRGENVIRIDNAVNVETAAHEIGHKLHDILYGGDPKLPIKERLLNVKQALKPWNDEFNAIGRYSPLDVEGHAEFTRMYVTNPKEAKRLAPRYFEHFEKTLKEASPEGFEALRATREAYKQYLEGSSYAREKANIVSLRNRSIKKRAADWYNKNINFGRFMTNWIDRMDIFKRAFAEMTGVKISEVENVESPLNIYHAFRGLSGWVEKADLFYKEETFNPVTHMKTGEGLLERFKKLMPDMTPLELDELDVYMKQKRGIDLEKRGIKSGSKIGDLEKNYKDLHGKYDALAKEYDDWLWQGQQYLVARGLRSVEQIESMRKVNPFYVPFHRFFEAWESRAKKTGGETGSLQAKLGFHKIFGSERATLSPIETGIQNMYHMIQMAEKNAAGQKLVKLAQTSPVGGKFVEKVSKEKRLAFEIQKKEMIEAVKKEALKKDPLGNSDEMAARMAAEILPESFEIWRPKAFGPEENVITVYFDGKPQYFETIPEIAELYKKNPSPYMSGLLFKMGVKSASILRTGAVLNVPFQVANFIRDFMGGFLFTKHPGLVRNFIYPFKAIFHAANKTEVYKDWIKAGGGMSTKQSITRNMEHIQKTNAKLLAKKFMPTEWIRWGGQILEESNRIAEYMKGVEDLGSEPWQKDIAAYRSRDISIDFAKAGLKGKAVNQVITFWNARLQGLNKLKRTVSSPKDLRNFMMGAVQTIVLPQLMLSYINKDDDEINDLPDYIKDSYFLFRVGDKIKRVPITHEPGLLINGMTRRLFNFITKEDPRAFDGFFRNIVQMGEPGAVPQILSLMHQIDANKDTFRNRDIVPPNKTGLVSEMQYNAFTSPTAYWVAKLLSYLPGVDKYRSKAASPMMVDFFLKSFAGTLGKNMLSLSDRAIREAGHEPFIVKPKENILVELGLDPFTVRNPNVSTEAVQQFYDTYGLYKKLEKSYKLALDQGKNDTAERLFNDMNKMGPKNIHKMAEGMETIQAIVNNLYKSKLPDKEKQAFLDSLYMQKAAFARGLMKEIHNHQDEK